MNPATARPVTLRDIALKADCHHTTVSLALRHHPSLPKRTAERIVHLAERMGYRRHPHLAAWMSAVRLRRGGSYKATLAYLDARRGSGSDLQPYFQGAAERAMELGYALTPFRTGEPGMTARRMDRILENSGIRGVVIGPIHHPHGHLSLDWSKLAAVSIGHSMLRPRLHRVAHHQARGLWTAVRAATKRGYRRIGLFMNRQLDLRTDYHYSSAMLRYQETLPRADRVPAFVSDEATERDLKRWFARHRVDCVVGLNFLPGGFQAALPSGIGGIDLDLLGKSRRSRAGIDQHYERIGATAVDLVCADLAMNRLGIPEWPLTVLIEGQWLNGPLLTPLPRA